MRAKIMRDRWFRMDLKEKNGYCHHLATLVGAEQVFARGGLGRGRRWRRILVDNERQVWRGDQQAARIPCFGPLLLRWRSPQNHPLFLCLRHHLGLLGSLSLSDSLSKRRFWMESKGATFPIVSEATMADKSTLERKSSVLLALCGLRPGWT